MSHRIAVLDYGSGNLHSVSRALTHVGGDVDVTSDPEEVDGAGALVIPGVGHFGQCMRALRASGLDRAAITFVATGRPVVGVCVGMQVLFEGSDEDPDAGLGVLPGTLRRFPDTVKVPHIGWNTAELGEHPYLEGLDPRPWFYFVHSYAAEADDEVTLGVTRYGGAFASIVARDNVFATQFHPEKSGEAGLRLYGNLVKAMSSS